MTDPQEIKAITNQRNMTSFLWLSLKRLKLQLTREIWPPIYDWPSRDLSFNLSDKYDLLSMTDPQDFSFY